MGIFGVRWGGMSWAWEMDEGLASGEDGEVVLGEGWRGIGTK